MVALAAGMVDQDPPHGPGCHAEVVGPAFPGHLLVTHETEIGFVDKSRGLQGVIAPLAAHVMAGQGAQLIVDERKQGLPRPAFPCAEIGKKSGDIATR